ncbi:hypothetical protein BOX15_Mlig012116g1 [Macrostomum lignano]|uniref:Clathrin/coatomer adaptor adaptin-like N-terminal domain-containing protein n=3 Tax=Macrostomum lignano TaxID=282301 RepID=A0A267FYN6_9PLAT|nr:hypothetical protein BOX15_Mlig012116g1 [Macrostomum lignano]
MSSNRFALKRLAYLAASLIFDNDSAAELLILATNLLRKDLCSACPVETSSTLCSLASFMTADLAKDLCNDLLSLAASSPYACVRARCTLLLPRLLARFPEAAGLAFASLRDRLADAHAAVRGAAVCAACELAGSAGANPGACLPLAPALFRLLCSGECCFGLATAWHAAKLLRLFALLTPLEPRLGRKLIDPIVAQLQDSSSIPLLYECVNTLVTALQTAQDRVPASSRSTAIHMCSSRLHSLLEHYDRNIRCLGLMSMARLTALDPKSAQSQRELVASACLTDSDASVSCRAADLLCRLACRDSLTDTVRLLRGHLADSLGLHRRARLLEQLLTCCSAANYSLVRPNFDWYIVELFNLSVVVANDALVSNECPLGRQLVEVSRCLATVVSRRRARQLCLNVLIGAADCRPSPVRLLPAAAWLYAEFADDVEDDDLADSVAAEAMLRLPRCPIVVGRLADWQQAALLHSGVKLTVKRALRRGRNSSGRPAPADLLSECVERLESLVRSPLLEVQERAVSCHSLLRAAAAAAPACGVDWLADLFERDRQLEPVGPAAQRQVHPPDGLDLDAWINAPLAAADSQRKKKKKTKQKQQAAANPVPAPELRDSADQQQQQQQVCQSGKEQNPHYLKSPADQSNTSDAVDSANAQLSVDQQLLRGLARSDYYLMQHRRLAEQSVGRRSKSGSKKLRQPPPPVEAGVGDCEDFGEESDELFSAAVVSTALDSPEVAGVSMKDNANSLLKEKQKKKQKKAKRESVSSSVGDYKSLPNSKLNNSKAKSVNLTEYLTVSSLSPGCVEQSDLTAKLELAWPTDAEQRLLHLRLRAPARLSVVSAHLLTLAAQEPADTPVHFPGCPLAPGQCTASVCVPWSSKRRARLKLHCLFGDAVNFCVADVRLPSLRLSAQLRPDSSMTPELLQQRVAEGRLPGQAQVQLRLVAKGATEFGAIEARLAPIARPLISAPNSTLCASVDSRGWSASLLAKLSADSSVRLEIRARDQAAADGLAEELRWVLDRSVSSL